MIAPHLLPDPQLHSKTCEIDAGFFFADGTTLDKIRARSAWIAPLSEAERHRLVEAAKSPTRTRESILAHIRWGLREEKPEKKTVLVDAEQYTRERVEATEKLRERVQNNVGSKTIIQFREWSEEWRIRTQVDTTAGVSAPSQVGPRESIFLTDSGARKIADSCAYMAKKHGGYKTFVTGTFNAETREKIARGETTIQREVTRTMDGLSKMYSRGWRLESCEEVPGHAKSLGYCWVVEVPKNTEGEDNPHVHMLLDWSVPFGQFKEWAARIEKIWNNGFFHLEKIDDPLCAGAYMAKAAGYISKANGADDQGRVRGNRYAISKRARAPEWETLGTFELGVMGHLIREVYDSITHRHARLFADRKRLNDQRDAIRVRAKKQQAEHPKNRYPLWAKHARDRIGQALMQVREKINSLPVRASKYQLVIKSTGHFWNFIHWAKSKGWGFEDRPDSHWFAEFKRRLYERKRKRMAWRGLDELAEFAQRKYDDIRESLSEWGRYSVEFRTFGDTELYT